MSIFRVLPPAEKVSTAQEADRVLRRINDKKLIAFDTETTGISRQRDYAVLLSLSDGEGRWAIWPEAIMHFQHFLEDPTRRLIAHNANFDQWMLLNIGIDLDRHVPRNKYRVIDTMVMHALYDDSAPHDLKYLSRYFMDIDMVPFKQLYGNQMRTRPLRDIFLDPKNEVATVNYSSLDAYATYKLFLILQRKLQNTRIENAEGPYTDMWDYYVKSEFPYTKVLWHMERRGVLLDSEKLLDRAPKLEADIMFILHWFCKKLRRYDINLNSNPQMNKLFFEKLGYSPITCTPEGAPQLNKATLKIWAKQGCEYAGNLLRYRDHQKNLGTYISGLVDLVHHDGRIHTTYNQTGARTSRLSCCAFWTPVITARGTIPIKDVLIGDYVWTHRGRWRRVTDMWSNGKRHTLAFVLENGQTLTVTTAHRLLTADGRWLTAKDYVNECFTSLGKGSRESGENNRNVSGRTEATYRRRHSKGTRDILRDGNQGTAREPTRSGAQSATGAAVLGVEGGSAESDERKVWRTAPQLDRRVRRWLRLPNVPAQRGPRLRASSGICTSSRAGTADDTAQHGSAPHRRKPEEQQLGQSSPGDKRWTQDNPLPAGEGLAWNSVEEVNFGGCHEVFDLSVEEDESYATCGIYSHNSSKPNLQNQPTYSRDAYIAPSGYMLMALDYSALEMRIAAHLSNDATLKQAILAGKDPHAATAATMYGTPYDDIVAAKNHDDEIAAAKLKGESHDELTAYEVDCIKKRKSAKSLNFGILYGMGPAKLARELGITLDEARDTINKYFQALPGVKRYLDRAIAQAKELGYCQNTHGRRRQVKGLWSPISREIKRAERQVKNSPIQSTAAEICKAAMIAIEHDEYIASRGVRMLLQVHDELVFELPEAEMENSVLIDRIKHHMSSAIGIAMRVPLETSGRGGRTWLDCK